MIQETFSRKNNPAITSNQWHVIRARWSGDRSGEAMFERSIVSEHEDHASAMAAGRELSASVVAEMADRPAAQRDQVFVRRPTYKSLKLAPRSTRRQKKD